MMNIRGFLANVFLWAHIILTATVFGGSIYETMVINSVWSADLPGSLAFMTNPQYSVRPVRFWGGLGGIPFLATLLALGFNFYSKRRRKLLLISFLCILINLLTTIFYFVPILQIIFAPDGGNQSGEELTRLANNWTLGTYGRMILLLVSLIVSILATNISLRKPDEPEKV